MELIIATITMIITAISLMYFIKSDLKKSRAIMLSKEIESESRFSRLEERTLAVRNSLRRIESELICLRSLIIKGEIK